MVSGQDEPVLDIQLAQKVLLAYIGVARILELVVQTMSRDKDDVM